MEEDAELVALLRESQRRQLSLLLVVLTVIVVLVVAVIVLLPTFRIAAPIALGGLGVGIGVLVTAPERRFLAELGLTPQQARDILARHAVAHHAPHELARRNARRRTAWLVVGAVSAAVLMVAGTYALIEGGKSHDENLAGSGPGPWFGAAIWAALITVVLTPTAFMTASTYRRSGEVRVPGRRRH